ncbi:hypothetical protein RHGRI_038229 [Rhododendron griersonianum]|uniref:Uncharacterized protein n=1 Tax=Rhododendron griersonianum TaxID=479676 RepID=A0AAV6HV88_9ERIC|nr:hypothetical protein RHGRI_038229 [Rhododendron griersonianum]
MGCADGARLKILNRFGLEKKTLGSRRFLFRHTFGRLQSEEAQFVRAEKHVKELNLSVDLMKNESRKLLERAALAEKDMRHGQSELMNAGTQIQRLARSVYKVEVQSSDLMDGLRELPGREALRLRAEASCFFGVTSPTGAGCYEQKSVEDFRIRHTCLRFLFLERETLHVFPCKFL